MPETSKEKPSENESEEEIVDKLLDDLGVDEDMKKELVESGRISVDVFKVESAEQVRRHMEMDKSTERLRESIRQVEGKIMGIDATIDRIERDIIPVVLSFLVTLKGNLVTLRGTIVGRSKRKAKMDLQRKFVESEVKSIIEDEFVDIEESLTSEVSTPILEKVRDVTEGLRESIKSSMAELATLKARIDDYYQRTSTEIEYLTKELSMKPKRQIPKDVEQNLKNLERRVEELQRDLNVSKQKLNNRELEISALQSTLAATKERNESLEETITRLKAAPTADPQTIAQLRQTITTLEATRDLTMEKLEESEKRAEVAERKSQEQVSTLAKKDLKIQDLHTKTNHLEEEIAKMKERLAEIDNLRAKVREYESGDKIRELDRISSELERVQANHDRMSQELKQAKALQLATQRRIDGYLGLMRSTEKTMAYLMVEETGEMEIRSIASSIGVSPAGVRKWAEDFEKLGIAHIVDDTKLILTKSPKVDNDEEST
jgi:chromosome segregation ATPase